MTAPIRIGNAELWHGDCLEIMPLLEPVSAIVCDPPYGLEFMGVAWDSFSTPKGGARQRNEWQDFGSREHPRTAAATGRVAANKARAFARFSAEWATQAYDVLKPGGYLLAFGGTRTWHRLACAIEDAGFVLVDTIAWIHGQGFPKGKNLLKPAFEPIVMAYKPGGKRELQIDECRIGDFVNTTPAGTDRYNQANFEQGYRPNAYQRGREGEASADRRYTDKGGTNFAAKPGSRGGSPSGRWPANFCHDNSDEVLTLFPQSGGQQAAVTGLEPSSKTNAIYGQFAGRPATTPRNDTGSAARFFFSAKTDSICELCLRQKSTHAPSVASSLNTNGMTSREGFLSAPSDALDYSPQGNADSRHQLKSRALSAENCSSPRHPITPSTVPANAPDWPLSRIVQNVKSAANLCDCCATAIAQELVAVGRGENVGSFLSRLYMFGSSRTILTRSLVSYVAHRENTDIILTTPSLKELFGSVFHAIAENTNSAKSDPSGNSAPKRLWYGGKANHHDRWGSKHPTVKPVELMKWLVQLVTPPNGVVLDPFAGSGTTGVAALAAGRDCTLIERNEQYCADIRERLSFYEGGGLHSMQAKHRNRKADHGPLFEAQS